MRGSFIDLHKLYKLKYKALQCIFNQQLGMNSKYLNLVKINQDSLPDSVQKYVNSNLSSFNQNKLFYFGYLKTQEATQTKKKFTFKANKQQVTSQKANFYNIADKLWVKHQIKGKIPQLRQKYLMINFQNYMLLYGGKNSANKQLNDIHSFSVQTLTWKKLFSIQGPSISQDNLLIKLTQTKIMLINHQIWTFELKNIKWQLNSNELPGGVWQNKGISLDNLKCTKLLNAIAIDEFLFIFYTQQTSLKCSLLDFDHKQLVEVRFSFSIKKSQKLEFCQIVKIKDTIKNLFILIINQQIILFEVKIQNKEYKIQVKDKLTIKIDNIQNLENIQCVCLTQNSIHVICNRQICSYQLKIKRIGQKTQSLSQKRIDKKMINSQSIAEQSNQQSIIHQKSNYNQFKQFQNSTQIIRSSNQIVYNSESFKDFNLQNTNNYQISHLSQNNEVINQQIIKEKIQPLLAYQHLKRVKLQHKAKLLQKQIKQSEKFVLSLICYSQQRQKIKHIQKMKDLRQQLQVMWNKQIFFRKQIQNQDKKTDMGKIFKKHK